MENTDSTILSNPVADLTTHTLLPVADNMHIDIGPQRSPEPDEANNFPLWCERNLRIVDKATNMLIPFVLNPPQRRLIDQCEALRLADKPVSMIVLKARQWGCTTVVIAYMFWQLIFHQQNANLAICGNTHAIVGNIINTYRRFLAQIPQGSYDTLYDTLSLNADNSSYNTHATRSSKKAPTIRKAAYNTYSFTGALEPLGNQIIGVSANNPDAARGVPVTMIHASEVAFWRSSPSTSPESVIRSVCNSLPSSGSRIVSIFESTANGTSNYFYDECVRAINGKSDKTFMFFPWYEVPYHRCPVSDHEAFLASLSEYESRIMREHHLDVEQIHWYRRKSLEYAHPSHMMAEYPTTWEEAFTAADRSVFPAEQIQRIADSTVRDPLRVGDLRSDSATGPGVERNITFVEMPHGTPSSAKAPFSVWAFPQISQHTQHSPGDPVPPGSDRYFVSVDIGGRTEDSDFSVITVFDRRHPDCPEVVAQWRGHLDFDLLLWKAVQIAHWYDNACLIYESNVFSNGNHVHDGYGVIREIECHYRNLYRRKHGNIGFHTDYRSKKAIIDDLIARIRDDTFIERSLDFIDEAHSYEYKRNDSMGAKQGRHDDVIMSRAIGLYCCREALRNRCRNTNYC